MFAQLEDLVQDYIQYTQAEDEKDILIFCAALDTQHKDIVEALNNPKPFDQWTLEDQRLYEYAYINAATLFPNAGQILYNFDMYKSGGLLLRDDSTYSDAFATLEELTFFVRKEPPHVSTRLSDSSDNELASKGFCGCAWLDIMLKIRQLFF
jgi:hypothetical protein